MIGLIANKDDQKTNFKCTRSGKQIKIISESRNAYLW